jgi:tRNA A-37 threonylcarbamoyl transferase component Bud32
MVAKQDSYLQRQILDFCRHVAGPYKITAVCQSDDYTLQVPSTKSTIEVLVVLHKFQPRLLSYARIIEGRSVVFVAVDQWVFERDVERGFLGEALASRLIFPYTPLTDSAYFHQREIILKKRLITELLENIVASYPELSYSLRIEPEYFMYEGILNRVRVFPPMAYGAYYILCGEASKEKIGAVLKGYLEALGQLSKAGAVVFSDEYIMISSRFIEENKNPKTRLVNNARNAPRTLFTSLFGIFPQMLNFVSQNAEAFFRFQTPPWKWEFDFSRNFVNPQRYICVPTTEGLVSLADKLDIRGYANRVLHNGDYTDFKVEEFGGVLNDVFLIKARTSSGKEKKILVKRFKDLSSFKWFPLSMWSIGTTTFTLMGKPRLERECAINELLREAGIRVPDLLYVSANERLVFMEYVEGENFSVNIKKIASSTSLEAVARELDLVRQVGETYAKIHRLNVSLGDTKPENILIDSKGRLCLIDFEQASRRGNKSWDVACFLYYCGHYMPLNGEQKAQAITSAFITGYLQGGGDVRIVKAVGLNKYTRIFSVFTLPSVLIAMANTCKKAEPLK